MKKAVLFLAIFGLSTGECCYGSQCLSLDGWELNGSAGMHGKRNLSLEVGRAEKQRSACECDSSRNLAEKRNVRFAYKLAESLGRVTLGTAAIAGTTLLSICSIEAGYRASNGVWHALAEFEELIFFNKIGFNPGNRLRWWLSAGSKGIFSQCFVLSGFFRLVKEYGGFVVDGYKFGGEQIYKGVWSVWTSNGSTKAS